MTLAELFEKLSFGELSNLYIGDSGEGTIPIEKYKAVISHINFGLTYLHTRFPIKERDVIIQSFDHISNYYLRPEYSHLSKEKLPKYKYIIDSPMDKFTGDVLRVIQVFNEIGEPLPMNDDEQWASVFTPTYESIQINHPSNESAFSVLYRANHTCIPINTVDLDKVKIDIPPSYQEALMYYVASRIFTNMGNQEHLAKGQLFLNKYESQCLFIENNDISNSSRINTNIKSHLRGWS